MGVIFTVLRPNPKKTWCMGPYARVDFIPPVRDFGFGLSPREREGKLGSSLPNDAYKLAGLPVLTLKKCITALAVFLQGAY